MSAGLERRETQLAERPHRSEPDVDVDVEVETAQQLRVALVHAFAFPEVLRGAERYLQDLAAALARRGHVVDVFAGTSGPSRVDSSEAGVTIRLVRHLRPGPIARFGVGCAETFGLRALRPLHQFRPDVVHALVPSAAIAGRLVRRPTLYTVIGHPVPEQIPNTALQREMFHWAGRLASVVAGYSAASARAASDAFARPAVVLTPGVHLERFQPSLSPRSGPPRILFPNSLSDERKRADLAVGALSVMLQTIPSARLRLVGQGDPSWALQAARHDPALRAAIDVVGPLDPDEIADEYRRASVTLLPSEHEAFGIVLLESLASGTPVVCTPSGGMPEIVSDRSIGRVSEDFSAGAVAAALFESIALAAEPGTPTRCRNWASTWSWDTVCLEHEHCYKAMLGGTKPRNVKSVSQAVPVVPTMPL